MWHHHQLRQIKQARQRARVQQHALAWLELEGIIALTLHTATHTLTVAVERAVGTQTADALYEALRDRRRYLKAEARQLRRDKQEEQAQRRADVAPASHPNPLP